MFGRQVSYRIYGQDLLREGRRPTDRQSLAQSLEPRLVLITCGGPFDVNNRNYEDNVRRLRPTDN